MTDDKMFSRAEVAKLMEGNRRGLQQKIKDQTAEITRLDGEVARLQSEVDRLSVPFWFRFFRGAR